MCHSCCGHASLPWGAQVGLTDCLCRAEWGRSVARVNKGLKRGVGQLWQLGWDESGAEAERLEACGGL